jgi:hypothetical protein
VTRRTSAPLAAVLAALAALAAPGCRRGEEGGRAALAAKPEGGAAGAEATFDGSRPRDAFALSADEVAARLGPFELETVVRWTVSRGPGSRVVNMTERHRVRQAADGAFEVSSVLDPGEGESAETGRTVVHAGGKTWARSRWTRFRERPEDLGADARRSREDGFGVAGDLLALLGPAASFREASEASAAGRRARRFVVAFERAERPEPPPAPAGRSDDPDTRARLELLEGGVPVAVDGEALLDAATGAPLRFRLHAVLAAAADPQLRAEVELEGAVTALGAAVAKVEPPAGALPDERKPHGPASALEAAGLKERGRATGTGERAAPPEEPEAAP